MSEQLKFEGRLSVKEREVKSLRLQIKGLVDSMRDHLDPTVKPENLEGEVIVEEALRLGDLHTDLRGALSDIAAINKALGK